MEIRFAIPTMEGEFADDFESFREFQVIDVVDNQIVNVECVTPSDTATAALPKWLEEDMGIDVVIAGRMAIATLDQFNRSGINVVTGVPSQKPQELVTRFLTNSLTRIGRF